MASSDLDPLFLKALKLLQSRNKESKDQLQQLYDEVVAQRKTELTKQRVYDGTEFGRTTLKKENIDSERKRELEKLKMDLAELSQEVPMKKIKLETSASSSSSSSPRSIEVKPDRERAVSEKTKSSSVDASKEKPRERLREIEEDIFFGPSASMASSIRAKDRERLEREEREKAKVKEKESKEKKESTSAVAVVPVTATTSIIVDSGSETEVSGDDTLEEDNGDQTDNMDDMQFELLGSLSCVICKSLSVTSSNRLLECQECHSLYHQDCHKPPVTDNVNDPRFVWYCSKCTKNLKKIVIKNQKKPVKPPAPVVSRESPVFKPAKPEPPVLLQPFKRIEPSKLSSGKEFSASGVTNGTSGGRGLAGLAANLNHRSSTTTAAPSATPPDSLKIKLDTSAIGGGGASRSGGSGRIESSKSSMSVNEPKPSTVSPGWGTINRTVPPMISSKTAEGAKPSASKSIVSPSSAAAALPAAAAAKALPPMASGSSTGVNAGGKMSQSTLMSADKRLQIMKKKAAAKMVEKRTR